MECNDSAVLDLEERREFFFRIILGAFLGSISFALFMVVGTTVEELLRKGVEIDSKVVDAIHGGAATLLITALIKIGWWVTFDPY